MLNRTGRQSAHKCAPSELNYIHRSSTGPWEAQVRSGQVRSYLKGPFGLYGAYFFQLILLLQNHHISQAVSPALDDAAVLQNHSPDSSPCRALHPKYPAQGTDPQSRLYAQACSDVTLRKPLETWLGVPMDELCSKVQRPVELRRGGPWIVLLQKTKKARRIEARRAMDVLLQKTKKARRSADRRALG